MDTEMIEILSERVHDAWMALKRRQGYADHAWPSDWQQGVKHSGECGIPITNHHPDMLPYADLAERIKEYDRVTVHAVLAAIEASGRQIVTTDDTSERPSRG